LHVIAIGEAVIVIDEAAISEARSGSATPMPSSTLQIQPQASLFPFDDASYGS
jgi:hypothetical protein